MLADFGMGENGIRFGPMASTWLMASGVRHIRRHAEVAFEAHQGKGPMGGGQMVR